MKVNKANYFTLKIPLTGDPMGLPNNEYLYIEMNKLKSTNSDLPREVETTRERFLSSFKMKYHFKPILQRVAYSRRLVRHHHRLKGCIPQRNLVKDLTLEGEQDNLNRSNL